MDPVICLSFKIKDIDITSLVDDKSDSPVHPLHFPGIKDANVVYEI